LKRGLLKISKERFSGKEKKGNRNQRLQVFANYQRKDFDGFLKFFSF